MTILKFYGCCYLLLKDNVILLNYTIYPLIGKLKKSRLKKVYIAKLNTKKIFKML